jgi:hypothetical protein
MYYTNLITIKLLVDDILLVLAAQDGDLRSDSEDCEGKFRNMNTQRNYVHMWCCHNYIAIMRNKLHKLFCGVH